MTPQVDAMAANCAQLRQSLAHLQTQLNTLTNKQKEESPAPEKVEKPEKSKKSKSKKNKAEKAKAEAEKAAAAKETESNEEVESSETTAKVENVEEIQPSANEDTTDLDTDKVDEKTLENLIQAINNANINLCDLEVVSDEILEVTSQENSEENSVKVEIKEIEAQTVEAKESTSNESPAASPVKESPVKEPSSESGEVANVETVIETNINDVNEVLSKFLNEVQEVTAVNGCGDADVTLVETSNEEVSQVNEVKPIPSDA